MIDQSHELKLDEEWEVLVDNVFAFQLLDTVTRSENLGVPPTRNSARLCMYCQDLDFLRLGFSFSRDVIELQTMSAQCELCNLLWNACKRHDGRKFPTVMFERTGSSLKMNGGGAPVLSLCRTLAKTGNAPPSLR